MIAVLDYDAGNLTSVACAVRHLGHEPEITRDPEVVRSADRVIFPGVGAAGSSMATLEKRGLADALRDVHSAGRPILGICIGCQVAFSRSEEDGGTDCLGLLEGEAVRALLAAGASTEAKAKGKFTPMHIAASQGHTEVIRALKVIKLIRAIREIRVIRVISVKKKMKKMREMKDLEVGGGFV